MSTRRASSSFLKAAGDRMSSLPKPAARAIESKVEISFWSRPMSATGRPSGFHTCPWVVENVEVAAPLRSIKAEGKTKQAPTAEKTVEVASNSSRKKHRLDIIYAQGTKKNAPLVRILSRGAHFVSETNQRAESGEAGTSPVWSSFRFRLPCARSCPDRRSRICHGLSSRRSGYRYGHPCLWRKSPSDTARA